jgi:hypothetical protein
LREALKQIRKLSIYAQKYNIKFPGVRAIVTVGADYHFDQSPAALEAMPSSVPYMRPIYVDLIVRTPGRVYSVDLARQVLLPLQKIGERIGFASTTIRHGTGMFMGTDNVRLPKKYDVGEDGEVTFISEHGELPGAYGYHEYAIQDVYE